MTPPPVLSMAFCLHCRTDMRLKGIKSAPNQLDERELTSGIACQQMFMAAILHGSHRIKKFEEQQFMHEQLTFIEGAVATETIEKPNLTYASIWECDSESFGWAVNETCDKVSWFKPGHPMRLALARTAFHVWKSLK